MASDRSAQFVARFEEAWAESSLLAHGALWSDEVELHQPLLGSLYGPERCNRAFAKLFALVPDLTTTVDGWAGEPDSLFISFTLSGTFGGAALRWPAVDRFLLDDEGLIVRRDSFFDASYVLGQMLRHPRGWPRALRSGLVPRRPKAPPWPAPAGP